jgi:hypothetical protein
MIGIKRCRKFAFGGKSLKKTLLWPVGWLEKQFRKAKSSGNCCAKKENKTKSKMRKLH